MTKHGGSGWFASIALLLMSAGHAESLDKYPLDQLHFQGTLDAGGTTYAMVGAPDGLVHRVAPGGLIGDRHGHVSAITRQGLSIVEPADAAQGTAERRVELVLASAAAPPDAPDLADACEREIRGHAIVTAIIGRTPVKNGSIAGYRIVFRGQPGSTVTAQCWSLGGKVTVVYADAGASHPGWGKEGRPAGSPAGASACDTEAEKKSFAVQLAGADTARLAPPRAAREGDVLRLQLDNGTRVELRDELRGCGEGTPDCTRYRFLEWRAGEHAYVIPTMSRCWCRRCVRPTTCRSTPKATAAGPSACWAGVTTIH